MKKSELNAAYAKTFKQGGKDFDKVILHFGVDPTLEKPGAQFAILKMTPEYMKKFGKYAGPAFTDAAKKSIQTGKLQVGEY